MPGPVDWWNRIRRVVGPPGAPATRAAVPADPDARRRAELAGIFTHLDRVDVDLRRVEQDAVREAAEVAARAEQEANRVRADAREAAATARATAAARRRSDLELDAEDRRARAARAAAELDRRARAAMTEVVDAAVERVRAFARSASDEPVPGAP
ncbi:MAG TPA: hypothetical protein VN636_11380 [Acidimicrobiia bacterium]|nr:hypothetical protein [Acidimicrobiia bacterium]